MREYFQLGLISALGAAIQQTAASSEQRPEVQGMVKKKLTAVEAPSSEIITLEPFGISVIAVLRQYLKTVTKFLVCQGTKVPQSSRLR